MLPRQHERVYHIAVFHVGVYGMSYLEEAVEAMSTSLLITQSALSGALLCVSHGILLDVNL